MNDRAPTVDDPRLIGAQDWFREIQGRIIQAMEALEREFAGAGSVHEPGRFALEPWERTDASGAPGGGGRMAMLRGRLFEKMGAHLSVVHGAFPAEFAAQIPGAEDNPRFWAAGVSVIAHPSLAMCRRYLGNSTRFLRQLFSSHHRVALRVAGSGP